MRKLPVYILIDTSGSMRGEPIEAVKAGLNSLFRSLLRDPHALDSIHISIITFDREAKILLPMTELNNSLVLPTIPPLESSPTNLGEALQLMCQLYDKEVNKSTDAAKGDWLPLAVIMTDGSPSDTMLFEEMSAKLKAKTYPFARIIGCAAGPKAKTGPLQQFATDVVILETMDSNSFSQFWQWVSQSFTRLSQNTARDVDELPPPPQEI
ncbi:MAG: VWA domain-containing protein, partial [Deltaproteobacteria bacterium]|nr:VWA domain-containing protein [Deltaproteobacteria bacterium]